MELTCNESVPLLSNFSVTLSPAVTRIVLGPTIFGGTAPVECIAETQCYHGSTLKAVIVAARIVW